MIGLEGSGFTICLGLILLLTGVVMYYCRKKIVECEHKVDSMFNLVAALNDELSELKNSQNRQNINNNMPADVSEESHLNETILHPYQELIPVQNNNNLKLKSDDSASEDDDDDDDEYQNENENENFDNINDVKVVQIEDLVVEDLNNDSEYSEDLEDEEDEQIEDVEENINDIKEIQIEEKIDYTKFSVGDLKKMVTEKQLANSVSRLRKPQLIALLSQ